MKQELLALKERIETELADIERTAQRAQEAWKGANRFPEQQEYYLDSVALNLHSFYNGVERIFDAIARQLDPVFPSGDRWHRDLLKQMVKEWPEARPAVITGETEALLDDFLAFRHRIRGLYAFDVDAERLNLLLERLPEALSQVRQDLERFGQLLAAAASDSDTKTEV